jgi:hypothetical protein
MNACQISGLIVKNIQVIDRAENCAYSIFAVSDRTFKAIFPGDGQDIEFVEDFIIRVGRKKAREMLDPIWRRRIDKQNAKGIHGTLFYQLKSKKRFYPAKREADLDDIPRGRAVCGDKSGGITRKVVTMQWDVPGERERPARSGRRPAGQR